MSLWLCRRSPEALESHEPRRHALEISVFPDVTDITSRIGTYPAYSFKSISRRKVHLSSLKTIDASGMHLNSLIS